MTVTSAEDRIRTLFVAWDGEGRPDQRRVNWNVDAWRTALPDHTDGLTALHDAVGGSVDRSDVAQAFTSVDTPERAEWAFVTAMVWGYGRTGYGPFRTARILTVNPDSGERLLAVAQTAATDPIAAYRMLANYRSATVAPCRLRHLGPAFGTKFLMYAAEDRPAPVLDALTAMWVLAYTGVNLHPTWWSTPSYTRYIEILGNLGAAVDPAINVGDVERLVFADASRNLAPSKNTQQWAEDWVPATGG